MSTHRVAHIADTHIDHTRRLDDTRDVLAAFVQQARDARVDLIVHAGDFFHRKSTPDERNVLAEFLQQAAEVAPVVGVRGNHDMDGDLDVFGKLRGANPVSIHACPTWVEAGPFAVLCLPWATKAHLQAHRSVAESSDASPASAVEGLLDVTRTQARDAARGGRIPILLSHCLVAGSETSTGQRLIGTTTELAPATLRDAGCEAVMLGHIHKPQGWFGNVHYSGSTERTNFGEPEAKGWRLWTFRNGRYSESEFVELPARRIVLIDDETAPVEIHKGDLVRYRYTARPEDLDGIDEDAIVSGLLERGAADVKIEAVIVHDDRVRSEAIRDASTTWERLEAFWEAKGIEVDESTCERLRAKLEALECAGEVVV